MAKHNKRRYSSALDYPLFESVIKAYLHNLYCVTVAPLQAVQHDPDATSHRRSTLHSVEFIVDVEKASAAALQDRQSQNAMDQILKEMCGGPVDESISLGLRADVVSKCARIYRARGLEPSVYFRRIRR